VDEEEALAAAETVATSKLHYATEHCHCTYARKRESLLPPSGGRKRTSCRAPKARGGDDGEARGGASGAARCDAADDDACGGGERAVGGRQRTLRDDTCHNCGRAAH
jgi:hypothetical protein